LRVGFIRNVAGVLATSLAAIPISIATSVVLARWLSVPDRGFYALLTAFSAVLFLLTQLGWAEAAIYRTRRHGVPAARVYSTGIAANSAIALAVLAICLAFREPISRGFLGEVTARAFLLAALTAPFLALGDFVRGVARALDRFDLSNAFGFLQSAGLLAALALALPGMGGALDAALAANLAVQALLVVSFGMRVGALSGFELRFDPREAAACLAYGANLYLQNLCIHLHERVDVFLLAALGVSARDIGLYAAAVSVVSPLRLVPGAIGTALLPQLAGSRDDEAAEFTAAVARQGTLVMIAIALGLVPAGMIGIPLLFGVDYTDAVTPFLWLLPGMAALALSRVLSRYFAAVHRQRALLAMRAAALVANVGLNLVLIPRLGIIGAALASLVSYGAEALGVAALFLLDSGRSARDAFALRASDVEPYRAQLRRLLGTRSH
jgi:O-antigen/teichoic acid export membrane protein